MNSISKSDRIVYTAGGYVFVCINESDKWRIWERVELPKGEDDG